MYYIFLENKKLNGCGECKCLDCINIEVEQDIYEDYIKTPNKYTWEEKEIEVEIPDFETVTKTIDVPIYKTVKNEEIGEDGNIIENYFTEEIDHFEQQEVEETIQTGSHTELKTVYVIILNPNYEKEEEEKEKERIKNLTCTKRVFALMLQELGISYSRLKELIASNDQAQLEWDLCIELLRSNPLLDMMAAQLGVTSEQLNNLFKFANGEITMEEFREQK